MDVVMGGLTYLLSAVQWEKMKTVRISRLFELTNRL